MSQQLIYGQIRSPDTGSPYYCTPSGRQISGSTAASYARAVISTPGTLKNLRVKISGVPGTSKSYTITLMKNGADTLLTTTISGATDTLGSDLVNQIAVVAGDSVEIKVTPTGNPTGINLVSWCLEFVPTTTGETILLSNCMGTSYTLPDNVFLPVNGGGNGYTEFNEQLLVPCSGTIKNLYVLLEGAVGAGKAYIFTIRKNGTGQILTVTVGGSNVTGNDTTHSFTVSAGDTISIQKTSTGSPSTGFYAYFGLTFVPDTIGDFIIGYVPDNNASIEASSYQGLSATQAWTSEGNVNTISGACILKNIYVNLNVVPGGVTTRTLTLRKNVSSTTLTTIINSAVFINNYATDIIVSNNDLLATLDTNSGTPAVAMAQISYTGFIAVPVPFQQTIYSNAKIKVTDIQNLIYSNAKIKVLDKQQTITSDAYVTVSIQQPIYSDAKIKILDIQNIIYSDAKIKISDIQEIIYSDAKIKKTSIQGSIASDARVIVPFEGKFIRDTNLYFITDTTPANIVKVSLLDPSVYTVYPIAGRNNGKEIVLNHTIEFGYGSLNNGYIVKFDLDNPATQTTYYVGENRQLYSISTNPDYLTTFSADAIAGLSLFAIDEATYMTINSDIRTLEQVEDIIKIRFTFNLGAKINSDIRTLSSEEDIINSDLRFNKYDYEEIVDNGFTREDFHVKIDNVELGNDDLILSSVEIVHSADSKSVASFDLARKHDDINNPITITSGNAVKIYLGTRLEFTGKIIKLTCDGSAEKISVSCKSEQNIEVELKTSKDLIELPLTNLDEKIHSYDILLDNIDIDYGTVVEDTDYRGVRINLGTRVTQKVLRYYSTNDWKAEIEDGTFIFEPNVTYFWSTGLTWYDLLGNKVTYSPQYIGTSLSGVGSDFYTIDNAFYKNQYIGQDLEEDLGYYTLGSTPYKDVNATNGVKITMAKWVDKDDGLYEELEASYDNRPLCYRTAANEFSDMKTINEDFVKASANIELTIDAYLYYNLKILNKINIVNTTQVNCYKNQNGFPLGVKQISISSGSMKISMNLTNAKALSQLSGASSQSSTVVSDDGYSIKLYDKFDLNSRETIQDLGED